MSNDNRKTRWFFRNAPGADGDDAQGLPKMPGDETETPPAGPQDRVAPEPAQAPQRPASPSAPERTKLDLSGDPAEGADPEFQPVAGWLVVVEGAGRGASVEVGVGTNPIGRAASQRVRLDFGDDYISGESHAVIIFDVRSNTFYLNHDRGSNLTRLNGDVVSELRTLEAGDIIEIGRTKLMFVPLCGEDFSWASGALI